LHLISKTFQCLNTNRVLSTLFKVFAGISREEASGESFRAALLNSVADALEVPAESVTLAVELARRSLLSSVSLSYTASVTSGMPGDVVLGKLNNAIAEGTYLALVREKSGLPISSLKVGTLADLSPVRQSAPEPSTSSSLKKGP
jgi:hypothetical protein